MSLEQANRKVRGVMGDVGMRKNVMEQPNRALDVDGYRERLASAVGMEISELIASRDDLNANPNASMLRMVAAYFLSSQDQLPVGDIAQIMDKTESWVRASTDYVERRVAHYLAFGLYVERTMATYALSDTEADNVKREAETSGVDIHANRQRAAGAVGMTPGELVADKRDDPDAETIQRSRPTYYFRRINYRSTTPRESWTSISNGCGPRRITFGATSSSNRSLKLLSRRRRRLIRAREIKNH